MNAKSLKQALELVPDDAIVVKAGLAKGGDEFVCVRLEPGDVIQFHAPTLAGRVGHSRSERKHKLRFGRFVAALSGLVSAFFTQFARSLHEPLRQIGLTEI